MEDEDHDPSYPDDEIWPNLELRGVGLCCAEDEARAPDARRAALGAPGRENLFSLDRPTREDLNLMNIAPNLPRKTRAPLAVRDHAAQATQGRRYAAAGAGGRMVLEDIQERVKREIDMKNNYKKLAGYLLSMIFLFAVITLQWGFGWRTTLSVLSNELWDADTGYKEYRKTRNPFRFGYPPPISRTG